MSTHWQDEIQKRMEKERLARKILGVDEHADAIAIKKSFWLLAMQYHPDKSPRDEEARKRFANIVNAYEFLVKGKEDGWSPESADAPHEEHIGEYLANEWGYFSWWRDNFDGGTDEPPKREKNRKPKRDDPESKPGDWW